ncbi:MAG: hypothetical protein AAF842_01545 [Planctomycetota bacterium]
MRVKTRHHTFLTAICFIAAVGQALADESESTVEVMGLSIPRYSVTERGLKREARIAIVLDASGSIIDPYALLTEQLGRDIRAMPDGTRLAIYLMQGPPPWPFAKPEYGRLQRARKAHLSRWLSESFAQGPMALQPKEVERLLIKRPDHVVVITDNPTLSTFGKQGPADAGMVESVTGPIVEKHEQTGLTFNLVHVVYPSPMGEKAHLIKLTEKTDGLYHFVSEEQLIAWRDDAAEK